MHSGDFSELATKIYESDFNYQTAVSRQHHSKQSLGFKSCEFDGAVPDAHSARAREQFLLQRARLPNKITTADVRIDHHFSSKDTIFGRYLIT